MTKAPLPIAPAEPALPDEMKAAGPSFPLSLKSLASLLMLALLVWCVRAWSGLSAADWTSQSLIFMAVVAGVVLLGYAAILTSTTSIDDHAIRQNWLWAKEARLAEIRQVKLIQVPGLHWLIVPRLVVRTSGLGVMSFPAGTPKLLAAFRQLAHGRHE